MLTIRSRTIATLAALALMLACAAPLVIPVPSHAQTHARAAQTHA
jgi:hypothetical protein